MENDSSYTHWDPVFVQLLQATLPAWGLEVLDKLKLGELPLEADLVIITRHKRSSRWKKHPLWQYLSPHNLIEFKSIHDPVTFGDFELVVAYTLLYRVKYKLSYRQKLSSWLIIPYIPKALKKALEHYQLPLTVVSEGIWECETLFETYIVEYNHLPMALDYAELKLFIKSGKPLQEVLELVIESKEKADWKQKLLKTSLEIHPKELKEFLEKMMKTKAHEELETYLLELTKETREKERQEGRQEGRQETARRMKVKGFSIGEICELTGLSEQEVKALSSV